MEWGFLEVRSDANVSIIEGNFMKPNYKFEFAKILKLSSSILEDAMYL